MASRNDTPSLIPVQAVDADLIRFEKNLLQIGFFGANDTRNSHPTTRTIEHEVVRDGHKIKVSAVFRSSAELGLPSTADRDKFIAFLKIVQDTKWKSGKITNPIRFSGYRMIKELGLSRHGDIYDDIMRWGNRMTDSTITSGQVVYLASKKLYSNETLHVFRSFKRTGFQSMKDGTRQETFEVVLEDWLLENLNQRYVVPEDFNAYKQLTRPTAKGIFGYLHLWFHASQGRPVERDYVELCNMLNIQSYPHLSKIKSTMGLALNELTKIKYLSKWDIQPMVSKKGYKIIFFAGEEIMDILKSSRERKKALERPFVEPASLTEAQLNAMRGLQAHGIGQERALQLVTLYGEDRVLDVVEHIEAQISRSRTKIDNPAGLIIYHLENDLPIPQSFMTTRKLQEIERQKKADQEQRDEFIRLDLEYREWIDRAVSEEIDARFSPEELQGKIRTIAIQRTKTDPVFKRVNGAQREAMALQLLRKEVREATEFPTFDEWSVGRTQFKLF